MATTINTYLARVKLLQASTLAALETAVNTFISEGLESGEYVTAVDVDVTTVRDAPHPVSLFTATVTIVGSTATEG